MARLKNPVGPHDKKVYLRRRLAVLGGLLAIVVVVLLIVFRPGSSGGVERATEVALPDDLTIETSPEATKKAEDDLPGCKKSDLAVTAVASKESYGAGENPEIWMTISNTSSKPCVVDLGTKEMVFEITSGSEPYWNSTHCQTGADSREIILEPDNPLSTQPIVWDRTRSAPETCDGERPVVPAGGAAYKVKASVNGVQSPDAWQFLLY